MRRIEGLVGLINLKKYMSELTRHILRNYSTICVEERKVSRLLTRSKYGYKLQNMKLYILNSKRIQTHFQNLANKKRLKRFHLLLRH